MELPPELLAIVRDFSKPILRVDLVRKYKDSMLALGCTDWPAVKEKIGAKDADYVIGLLVDYAEATLRAKASRAVLMGITKVTHPKQKLRWAAEEAANKVYFKDESARKEASTVLDMALVGKEEYLESERKRKEEEEEFERAMQEELDEM